MTLADLGLDRQLYRDDSQITTTPDAATVSADSSVPGTPAVPSGGAAQDINTGNVTINGNQLTPGTYPVTVLDVANWGWGQTSAFSSTDADTVSWGAGTFTSADGTSYAISAGNTGNMTAKTYIYFDLLTSTTTYQVTTDPSLAVGIGKVLIGVAQNETTSATYNLSEATQIVGDNILANSIDASKIKAGSVAVGVYLTVGSGNNIFKSDANGIYLGNANFLFAPFSVDMLGNTVVSSLQRTDFHWFTLFESVDGYGKTGTPTLSSYGVSLKTAALANDTCEIQKISRSLTGDFTWNKRRKIKFSILLNPPMTLQAIDITTGNGASNLNDNKFGFIINGTTVYGITADGSGYTAPSITSVGYGAYYVFEADFVPGSYVKFYVNGLLYGTNTTNLPTGNTGADMVLDCYIKTLDSTAKEIDIGYYDFWQANQ